MSKLIAVLAGDGIGAEIVAEGVKLIERLVRDHGLDVQCREAAMGGTAYDAFGTPLPDDTLALCRQADAVLLGAVGGPRWDTAERELRPERALLQLRSELELYANLRPAVLFPQLADASSLKADLVSGLDILIVRELTGGIYFGEPRGIRRTADGQRDR